MTVSPPTIVQLQDVLSFNEQLIAISRAGIPLAFIPQLQGVEKTLRDWSGRVAMQVGRGHSVGKVLENIGVSDEYHKALENYVALGGSIQAAQILVRGGSWRDRTRTRFSLSLLGTWIVWVLACMAWLVLISALTPSLRSLYQTSNIPPGPAYAWLNYFYSRAWWWMAGLAALTFLAPLVWRITAQRSNWLWLPYRQKVLSRLTASARMRIESECAKQQHADISTRQTWNAWADALDAKAQRDADGMQAWAPTLMAAFLGSLIVMGVGIVVFWPLVEYLIAICQPPEVYRVRK